MTQWREKRDSPNIFICPKLNIYLSFYGKVCSNRWQSNSKISQVENKWLRDEKYFQKTSNIPVDLIFFQFYSLLSIFNILLPRRLNKHRMSFEAREESGQNRQSFLGKIKRYFRKYWNNEAVTESLWKNLCDSSVPSDHNCTQRIHSCHPYLSAIQFQKRLQTDPRESVFELLLQKPGSWTSSSTFLYGDFKKGKELVKIIATFIYDEEKLYQLHSQAIFLALESPKDH